jgi:predicted DCC family thiol-disulfide oxidoreductase YuxK
MGQKRQRYLIYDGDCGFCDACVRLARAYDRRRLFTLIPFQSLPSKHTLTVSALSGLVAADCVNALQVITANGRIISGARAINHFLWQRWPGKILVGLLVAIPPLLLLEMVLYRLVARYRHRLSNCLGLRVCAVPGSSRSTPGTLETGQPRPGEQKVLAPHTDR